MKKSIIAIVAAVGIAFASTSAIAEGDDNAFVDGVFPSHDGIVNISEWKPADPCGPPVNDWKKCAFEPKGENDTAK